MVAWATCLFSFSHCVTVGMFFPFLVGKGWMTREGCMFAGPSSEFPFFICWFLFGCKSRYGKSANEPRSGKVPQFVRGGGDGSKRELGRARLGGGVRETGEVAA